MSETMDKAAVHRGAGGPAATSTDTPKERALAIAQRHGSAAVLVLVVVAACLLSPGFADWGNFQSILVGNAYTSLLALGMTFVIISGGIDLSVGSMFALGGVLAAWGVQHGGTPVAVLLPLVCGGALGTVHGLLISRDARYVFVSNRNEGSVSVISTATNIVVATISGVALLPEGIAIKR